MFFLSLVSVMCDSWRFQEDFFENKGDVSFVGLLDLGDGLKVRGIKGFSTLEEPKPLQNQILCRLLFLANKIDLEIYIILDRPITEFFKIEEFF
jgi:hypothetical protein